MDIKDLEKELKALANHRRIAIVKYLYKVTTASVGDIAEEIKLSFRSTSRHLAVLRLAGVVSRDQQSLMAFYKLQSPKSKITSQVLSMC